jgi:hypothetical protein
MKKNIYNSKLESVTSDFKESSYVMKFLLHSLWRIAGQKGIKESQEISIF